MNKKQVIIIGAGPGGLTSAMILAHRGFKVTVFEKEKELGGRNAPIHLDGCTFDTGPTFLMMDYVLREMFQEAGRNAEDYLTFVKLDPLYRLKFEDFEFLPSYDREKTKNQIKQRFPGNDEGLDKFLRTEAARFEKLYPCLCKDYGSLSAFLDPVLIKALPYLSMGRTIFETLGDYYEEDKVKICFTFQAKYLGMSPWECPALFTMLPYLEHAFGVYHVIGGLNSISQAMAKVVEEQGGQIIRGARVKQLVLKGREVKGVELESGEKVHGDDVIINADFAYAATHLVPQGTLKKYSAANIQKKRFSCSTFMVYLGINKKYDSIPHHNVLFAADYRKNVEEIADKRILSDDPSVYVQNASVTDPTLAREGKSTLYLLAPVPNNRSKINWDEIKEAFTEKVLDLVIKRGGFDGLRDHIEIKKVITPKDWEEKYNIHEGATFNLAHNFNQLLYFRPRNKFEELEHCYLVGGGTHPGSGLPTIYESGRISSNLVCKAHGESLPPPASLKAKDKRI